LPCFALAKDDLQYRLLTCESGGIGRRTRLRIWRRKAWGFESPLSHQQSIFEILRRASLAQDFGWRLLVELVGIEPTTCIDFGGSYWICVTRQWAKTAEMVANAVPLYPWNGRDERITESQPWLQADNFNCYTRLLKKEFCSRTVAHHEARLGNPFKRDSIHVAVQNVLIVASHHPALDRAGRVP
jgi:hypothetical protein